jgi:hypothetical protein
MHAVLACIAELNTAATASFSSGVLKSILAFFTMSCAYCSHSLHYSQAVQVVQAVQKSQSGSADS